ncbi:hypothetical protein DFR64_2127 [Pelolinea submarina]|uniref:Uncharacterized protein n=1 Tax=Pelolinea submarina TaxID=913107 RepID=A0A3E0ABB8_9CHLR|nr:hypothetical protein DFR64_2127 [Pelolinea submarina]
MKNHPSMSTFQFHDGGPAEDAYVTCYALEASFQAQLSACFQLFNQRNDKCGHMLRRPNHPRR